MPGAHVLEPVELDRWSESRMTAVATSPFLGQTAISPHRPPELPWHTSEDSSPSTISPGTISSGTTSSGTLVDQSPATPDTPLQDSQYSRKKTQKKANVKQNIERQRHSKSRRSRKYASRSDILKTDTVCQLRTAHQTHRPVLTRFRQQTPKTLIKKMTTAILLAPSPSLVWARSYVRL